VERPKSSFSYYCYETREPDQTCTRETVVLSSSRPLGWDGVAAEVGRSRSWEPVGLAMVGHYLAINPLLAEVTRGGSSGPLYSDGLLIALVSRLARAFGCSPATSLPAGALSTERLTLVIEAIEDRIDHRLTVDELAAVAGLSPAHFAREFKRTTRETPHAFVVRRRLERARQLLIDGCSITDVALRCGFNDQAHLSRAFKGKFGLPPGAFARSVRGKHRRGR
jgi:AraC-like DNA-binding protein